MRKAMNEPGCDVARACRGEATGRARDAGSVGAARLCRRKVTGRVRGTISDGTACSCLGESTGRARDSGCAVAACSCRGEVAGRVRGTVSVEAALLVPVFLLIVSIAAAGWRIWWGRTQVQAAAEAAARAASLQTDAMQAHQVAVVIATANTTVPCADLTIDADVGAVALPAGAAGLVRVQVTCTVRLGDLLVRGLPGSVVVSGEAREPIDIFHGRGP